MRTPRKLRYILDDEGNPVQSDDESAIMALIENLARRTVAATDVGTLRVTTFFMVMDYALGEADKPILWETMVSDKEHGWLDHLSRYYTSVEGARRGHVEVVTSLLKGEFTLPTSTSQR